MGPSVEHVIALWTAGSNSLTVIALTVSPVLAHGQKNSNDRMSFSLRDKQTSRTPSCLDIPNRFELLTLWSKAQLSHCYLATVCRWDNVLPYWLSWFLLTTHTLLLDWWLLPDFIAFAKEHSLHAHVHTRTVFHKGATLPHTHTHYIYEHKTCIPTRGLWEQWRSIELI